MDPSSSHHLHMAPHVRSQHQSNNHPSTKHPNAAPSSPAPHMPSRVLYSHRPNEQPNTYLVPVTCESQCNGFWITLPVLPIPAFMPSPPITHHGSLLCNIQSNLPNYAPELWTKIDPVPHQDLPTLQQYLTATTGPLLVVSDASLNLQKQSAFSWIISTTTQVLWTGSRTVPGTQRDAYSGRAEGFGLLAALSFLEQYLHHLSVPPASTPPLIKGYCNNSGLIQQVNKMHTNKIPNPSWAIKNDYDLHNKIVHTILCLPLPTKLFHIKGHQDNDTQVEDLLYKARLNIECNKQARTNLASFPINVKPNPTLPTSYPHLQIGNQTILRQHLNYIHKNNLLLPIYHTCLTNKFKWTNDLQTQIEWGIIEPAMRQLPPNNCTRIRKMIHKWIPT